MPRYVIEREFPDGLNIPVDAIGRKACPAVVDKSERVARSEALVPCTRESGDALWRPAGLIQTPVAKCCALDSVSAARGARTCR
jgi:hypothetical protein